MVNSFKSWGEVNEATGSKQVYISPSGHKFKVVIKIQNSTNFMVKTIGEMELLDANSNMTNKGASSIKQYFNSQQAFINTVGKLDNSFFTKNFIIYTVVRDTNRKEKIQFTVAIRSEVEGLDAAAQFVSTSALKYIQNKTEALDGIITGNIDQANNDEVQGESELAIDGDVKTGEGTDITEDLLGNRFRYTMRTNGVTYVCTIGGGGVIEMEPYNNNKAAVGAISWDSPKVIWYTDADNNTRFINNAPLFMDAEITNNADKIFFTKMFTDKKFSDEIIKEYEDEYGNSEINGDSLRGMLYYDDYTPIFHSSAHDKEPSEIVGTSTANSGALRKSTGKNYTV